MNTHANQLSGNEATAPYGSSHFAISPGTRPIRNSLRWLRRRFSRALHSILAAPLTMAAITVAVSGGAAQAQNATCYFNWAMQWDSQNNYDNAIANYTQAIYLCPSDSTAYNNRGYDYYRKGNFAQAIADYNQSLALCPTNAAAYSSRGVVYDDEGETDRALAEFNQALAVDPNFAMAYNNRGALESTRGQYELAKADFYRSMAADPDCAAAYENLGFLLAACPDAKIRDAKRAFDNASHGYQLDAVCDPYSACNALAAAYAENGDFAQAAAWQAKVVDAAPEKDKPMQTTRLEQFKNRQPYRSKVVPSEAIAAAK